MGTSTDALLVYGYDIGNGDEWKVAEVVEGALKLPWSDEETVDEDEDAESDFAEAAIEQLRGAHGFTETDWQVDGFFDRQREADEYIGVKIKQHCHSDYPMWVLAAFEVTAGRGDVVRLDLVELERRRVVEDWDEKLGWAAQVLGMTPLEPAGWFLVSYWGA